MISQTDSDQIYPNIFISIIAIKTTFETSPARAETRHGDQNNVFIQAVNMFFSAKLDVLTWGSTEIDLLEQAPSVQSRNCN